MKKTNGKTSSGNDQKQGQRMLIPLREAAAMLSVSRQTVMNYVNRGQLTCVRPTPTSVFFRPADLEAFVEKHLETRTPLNIAA
ncbi:helix-turn-helix domain-containing protein [bacterium]|nr:helix-turn-helix domain-containing protein [bacterium]